jgi:hypothetical protein
MISVKQNLNLICFYVYCLMVYVKVFFKILFTTQYDGENECTGNLDEKQTAIEVSNDERKSPVKKKKRAVLSFASKAVLENWFHENKSHPYAKKETLIQLSVKTGIPEFKIQRWIEHKRSVLTKDTNIKPHLYFSINDKKILVNFFQNQTSHPGPGDLTLLSKILGKDEKKIREWFNNQRYKAKLK